MREASARSADRPQLQALLRRLADTSQPAVSYVIVHKLDRLARARADDVDLLMAIQSAGAELVSVSEQIDGTPAGMLLHGIMASLAEFYSLNLSNEAKKGMGEKAKRGGTIGYAPVGYRNVSTRLADDSGVERDVKTVEVDPERAPHVIWAFQRYAEGDISITSLTAALAARGLTSRRRISSDGTMKRSAVHTMLSNPYYIGHIPYHGMEYPGLHEPLIDETTFALVQNLLEGRRTAGDRSYRRTHYVKGALHCARCGSRLGFSLNTGRGGSYYYFFCLGRAEKRTNCDLPYLQADLVEDATFDLWHRTSLTDQQADVIRHLVRDELDRLRTGRSSDLKSIERTVAKLTGTKQRLLDAYLAEAVQLADFRTKQELLDAQLSAAQRRLNDLTEDYPLCQP